MSGKNIASIQFRRAGKCYDFSYDKISLKTGDFVLVETEKGLNLGEVVRLGYYEKKNKDRVIKPIIRKATVKEKNRSYRLNPEEITEITKTKAAELELQMKVLKSEVQYGGGKALVFFSASGRVDFRELVKQLASTVKSKIELKQVGARDETKLLGGIGICGREYCCSSFLREFVPVSIKMAKNQNLALNPYKVSGGCGRLLCCLTYENDTYNELRKELPTNGSRVEILDTGETGLVLKSDLLNQTISISLDEQRREVIAKVSEIKVLRPFKSKESIESDRSKPVEKKETSSQDQKRNISTKSGKSKNQGSQSFQRPPKKQHYKQKQSRDRKSFTSKDSR